MNRPLFVIFCITFLMCRSYFLVKALTAETWPKVKFAEVRAYAWPGETSGGLVLDDLTLRAGMINKEGAKLDAAQINLLLQQSPEAMKIIQLPRVTYLTMRSSFTMKTEDLWPLLKFVLTALETGITPKVPRNGLICWHSRKSLTS